MRALRLSVPVNPETLASYPRRIGPNRTNPYFAPGASRQAEAGSRDRSDTTNCANGGYPDLAPPSANFTEDLRNRILKFIYQSSDGIAPACKKQGKNPGGDGASDYPQVREDPRP